jgi:hypothetical protein
MRRGGKGCAITQLARTRFGIVNKFGQGIGGNVGPDHHQLLHDRNLGNRLKRRDRVVIEIAVECGRHRQRSRGSEQQRVAVGRRSGHESGCDGGAAAWAVLDDDGLAETCAQRLGHEPRHGVDRSARRKRHDQLDRLLGISLCCKLRRDPENACRNCRAQNEPSRNHAFLRLAWLRCVDASYPGRPPHALGASALSVRTPRPRAAEQHDELAPHHSMSSSASNWIELGTSTPSALAVCMLMTNSNLVDCKTGRSAGFAPLRI